MKTANGDQPAYHIIHMHGHGLNLDLIRTTHGHWTCISTVCAHLRWKLVDANLFKMARTKKVIWVQGLLNFNQSKYIKNHMWLIR